MRRFFGLLAVAAINAFTLNAQSATRLVDRRPSVTAGKLDAHVIYDSSYQRPRRVWVYTPPGYDPRAAAPYPLILAFDGDEYRDTMPLPMVLDTLLAAKKAPAFVAVMVDDSAGPVRIADLGNSKRMADFLARQLMPWVRKGWHVTSDPHQVIVTGSSAGGLGSAYVAFMHPELFGNVWSQSGAFWRGAEASNSEPYEWLTSQVKAGPRKPVKFVLDVGALEDHATLGGSGPNFRDANRRFRDALEAKGYEVTYTEVPGGNHAPQWWQVRLPDGIVLLSAGWSHGQVKTTPQTSNTAALLIAVSPVNEQVVWVSGSQGAYVRTTDGGTTWRAARVPGADSLQFRDVHAVDANTAYLLSIGNGNQSRIYKTTDAGANWTLQFTNPDSAGFYDCMDFWTPKRGIVIGDAVGGEVVILTTSDGGAHWTRVKPSLLPPAQPNEGSFAASGTCLVTAPGGHAWIVASNPDHGRVLHTSNYGMTWSVDTLPLTTRAGSGPQSIAFRDVDHGMALGGGNAAQPGDVLAAFTNTGGKRWTTRTSPPLRTGAWGGVYVPGAARPTIVAVGPAGAVWSADEGATWTPIDTLNYWSVGFASPRAGWAVGTQGKITKLSGF